MLNIGTNAISSQFLLFNSQIQIRNKSVFFPLFSERDNNFVGQLFKTEGALKSCEQLRGEYGLANKMKCKWIQLIHSLSKWYLYINGIYIIGKFDQSRYPTPSLNQKNQILSLKTLDNKELYNIQLLINFLTPNSQGYFENVFAGHIVE